MRYQSDYSALYRQYSTTSRNNLNRLFIRTYQYLGNSSLGVILVIAFFLCFSLVFTHPSSVLSHCRCQLISVATPCPATALISGCLSTQVAFFCSLPHPWLPSSPSSLSMFDFPIGNLIVVPLAAITLVLHNLLMCEVVAQEHSRVVPAPQLSCLGLEWRQTMSTPPSDLTLRHPADPLSPRTPHQPRD